MSDPDPKQIVTDPDPDPGKSYGPDGIRIRNTEIKLKIRVEVTPLLYFYSTNIFIPPKRTMTTILFFYKNQRVPYHLVGSFELGMNPLNDRMLHNKKTSIHLRSES